MMWILILFAVFDGGSSSAVRVGFNSLESCTAGAKEVTQNMRAAYPTAKIDWSCIRQ
jgi:hypothetical protein